jgi:3-hydroxybutyryl-CoA dehydrogenase
LAKIALLAKSDQCSQVNFDGVAGTLQKAGYQVSRIDDIAGMLACRTICMLANEAADSALQGVASIEDIDIAMRFGTNYPKGPLRWADDLSLKYVFEVLSNLSKHYGEERYRVSPLIQRKAISGDYFYGAT